MLAVHLHLFVLSGALVSGCDEQKEKTRAIDDTPTNKPYELTSFHSCLVLTDIDSC